MIVVISGSRKGISPNVVELGLVRFIEGARMFRGYYSLAFRVGDSYGVDEYARNWLIRQKEGVRVFTASDKKAEELWDEGFSIVRVSNWDAMPRRAGMVRNSVMLRGGTGRPFLSKSQISVKKASHLLYFWDGESPGTGGAIQLAKKAKLELIDGVELAK